MSFVLGRPGFCSILSFSFRSVDSSHTRRRATSNKVQFHLAGGQNPLMIVPTSIDAKGPYQFILDTGASHCLLSPELSTTPGIQPASQKTAMGAGGSVTLAFAHVNSISVSSARQQDIQAAIINEIQRIAAAVQTRVDGVLGFSFLKDFVLTIDYKHSVLHLLFPSEYRKPANSDPSLFFKLASVSKSPILVPTLVNGQGPFQFAPDTGASRTVLSSELTAKLAIAATDDGPLTRGGGQIKISAGKLNSLAVGNLVVRNHAVGVGDFLDMLSIAVGSKLDGIIGYNFLNQFRVTIDYPRVNFAPPCPNPNVHTSLG